MVRGDTPGLVSNRMARVARLAFEHNGMVDCKVSALVVAVFGVLPIKDSSPGDARRLTQTLLEELVDNVNVKVACTAGGAQFGAFGSELRAAYPLLIAGFCTALSMLCALQFGEARDVGVRRVA
ncbi:MAG: hypothetical protein ND866_32365 [Pyrinomonadaceae bacterium]|nr:hypothetical protein [Pyrinomonadaceae bacterium]